MHAQNKLTGLSFPDHCVIFVHRDMFIFKSNGHFVLHLLIATFLNVSSKGCICDRWNLSGHAESAFVNDWMDRDKE